MNTTDRRSNLDHGNDVTSEANEQIVVSPQHKDLHSRAYVRAPYSVFSRRQKTWAIFIAAWSGWFSTASSFIYFPAIPFMAAEMNVSVLQINLTVTSYLIASGIFPTITGSVADAFGRRITLLVSLFAYAITNIGLALQRSFPALLLLRMLQSASISGRSPNRRLYVECL